MPPPDFRLYLITDRKLFPDRRTFFGAIGEALAGGVRAVQLREKDLAVRELLEMAYTLRDITGRHDARLFVNDRVDIALAVGADGVHLGGTSMPVRAARKAAGKDIMIGVSAHGVTEAGRAEKDGADFVTLGPVYETPSKMRFGRPLGPDAVRNAKEKISIPLYAIGGIKHDNAAEVLKYGADGIALISAILAAGDVKSTTERMMRLLK